MSAVIFRPARREDVPAIVRLLAEDKLGSERERSEEPLPESYYTAFDLLDKDANQFMIGIFI